MPAAFLSFCAFGVSRFNFVEGFAVLPFGALKKIIICAICGGAAHHACYNCSLFFHHFQFLRLSVYPLNLYHILARAETAEVELHCGGAEKGAAADVDYGGTDEAISEDCDHIGGGIRVERHCRSDWLGDAVADLCGDADGTGGRAFATGDGERDALRTGIVELKHFGAAGTACAPLVGIEIATGIQVELLGGANGSIAKPDSERRQHGGVDKHNAIELLSALGICKCVIARSGKGYALHYIPIAIGCGIVNVCLARQTELGNEHIGIPLLSYGIFAKCHNIIEPSCRINFSQGVYARVVWFCFIWSSSGTIYLFYIC